LISGDGASATVQVFFFNLKVRLMKKILLASVGILALGVASASAADLPRREAMPTKAPIYSAMYNWTGAYVGINGGYGWKTNGGSNGGGLVGGTVGYNWQAGSPVVWGLEADLDYTRIRGSENAFQETSNRWLGTVRGRLGYALGAQGTWLPFITGGLAVGDVKNSVLGLDSRKTKAGYVLGAGLEVALSGPWTAKVEYQYVDLGNGPTVLGLDSRFKANIVKAGLNYRF
jgi:outer membrane immunogenic protein